MEQRHRDRNAEKRSLLEGAGQDSPEPGVLTGCCRWPYAPRGAKGVSK